MGASSRIRGTLPIMFGLRDFIAMLEWLVRGDDAEATEVDATDTTAPAAAASSTALSLES